MAAEIISAEVIPDAQWRWWGLCSTVDGDKVNGYLLWCDEDCTFILWVENEPEDKRRQKEIEWLFQTKT